ncbi:MAG: ATP-dependent DNA helicase RecG [Lautropia sp.]
MTVDATDARSQAAAIDPKYRKLGIRSEDDLLLHLPLRYEDETRLTPIGSLADGEVAQVEGEVVRSESATRGRRSLVAVIADGSGEMTLRFLHFLPWQVAQLAPGRRVRAIGEARHGLFGAEMVHPRYRIVAADTPLPSRLTPVYPSAAGIAQHRLRQSILDALSISRWTDTVPREVVRDVGLEALPSILDALREIHRPPAGTSLSALLERRSPAARRVAFEELLAQQLSLRRARAERAARPARALRDTGRVDALIASLPFALTGAQRRAWSEISSDLARRQPMNRLLQGDVGSGKTIVSALAALQAIGSGCQAALMAPTEILARQHVEKLSPWLESQGVRIGWLVGSMAPKAKRRTKEALAAHELDLLVGTHALIEDSVVFSRLALAIVDEQHRFGVAQRLALREHGARSANGDGEAAGRDGRAGAGGAPALPHQLMMSATPIPRTLAMTAYADLDVSVIDELPPGRKPVLTKLIADSRRDEVVERVRVAVADGRQVYWVCPLIEESDTLDLENAVATFERLAAELQGLRVALVHGRQPAQDKHATMRAFKAGDVDLLVSTTVIEVGVDVPNASLMVIEHAERFGLSQLHQLRGRIGRGAHSSVCVLMYRHPAGRVARERLKTMFETADGFEIAQRDLDLRGPGDFLGARQSGLLMLRFADIARDAALVDAARAAADAMLRRHPVAVDRHLARWFGGRESFLRA